jgi:hypothetical protein
MTKNQRIVHDQLDLQRWQASQAHIQIAALNGELGPEAQIIALSALYMELRAQGRMDEARALKDQAYAIREAL